MEQRYLPNRDISFLIKKLDHHIQRNIYALYNRKEFQECSLMNMWVTDYLFDMQQADRPVFQKDVEAEFSINRATASKMLTLMEQKQLIRRTSHASDSRLKQITLEPRGLELQTLCRSIREEMEARLTATLTEDETAQFKSLCIRMMESL